LPVVAEDGTVATIEPAVQLVTLARAPLKLTLPAPWELPKFDPVMFTEEPAMPELGLSPLILGAGVTVNATPLLAWPLTVTTTEPVVAPVGTMAVIPESLQAEVLALVPLNLTVLVPLVLPKPEPTMAMDDPTAPELGVKLVMVGVAKAVAVTDQHSINAAERHGAYGILSPFNNYTFLLLLLAYT
jgi:hypothetical protein